MAFLLLADKDFTAALNCYSSKVDSFTQDARHIGQLFATHASVAMGKARVEHDLSQVLITRKEIGQAIGILMGRYNLTEDRAFQFLVRQSRDTNTKLREVAHDLVQMLEDQAARAREGLGSGGWQVRSPLTSSPDGRPEARTGALLDPSRPAGRLLHRSPSQSSRPGSRATPARA